MKEIIVVGVGALGSHTIQFIRGCEANLRAIDFDRVEHNNTTAQFHGEPHIGKLKVQAIKQTMDFLWAVKIHITSAKLVKNNVAELVGTDTNHLVVDCLDNGASRRVLQEHVRKHNIPCVHGALAADGAFGRVIWDKDFLIDLEVKAGAATCEGGEHLPFIGVVSSLLAYTIQEWAKSGKHIGFSISPGGVIKI